MNIAFQDMEKVFPRLQGLRLKAFNACLQVFPQPWGTQGSVTALSTCNYDDDDCSDDDDFEDDDDDEDDVDSQ